MIDIYLIGIEILLLGILFKYLSFFYVGLFSAIIIYFNFIFYGKRGGILSLVLLVFIFNYEKNIFKDEVILEKNYIVKAFVENGRGKVEKIDGKYLHGGIYIYTNGISDGYREIQGKFIEKIDHKYLQEYYFQGEKYKIVKENFIREFLKYKSEKLLENYSYKLKNFYFGVILGDKSNLDYETVKKFRKQGLSHILVISGLHMGIIMGIIKYIVSKFKLKREVSNSIVLFFLTLYVIGIGAYPSVLRAYIMGGIYLLGNIFYEKNDSKKTIFIGYIISISLFPHWIWNISTLLSYTAVGIILYIYPKIPTIKCNKKIYMYLYKHLTLILTLQLFMCPIYIYFFKNIPILTFIPNFFILPIGTIFILLGFLSLFLSLIGGGIILMPFTNITFQVMIYLIEVLDYIPYLTLEI